MFTSKMMNIHNRIKCWNGSLIIIVPNPRRLYQRKFPAIESIIQLQLLRQRTARLIRLKILTTLNFHLFPKRWTPLPALGVPVRSAEPGLFGLYIFIYIYTSVRGGVDVCMRNGKYSNKIDLSHREVILGQRDISKKVCTEFGDFFFFFCILALRYDWTKAHQSEIKKKKRQRQRFIHITHSTIHTKYTNIAQIWLVLLWFILFRLKCLQYKKKI